MWHWGILGLRAIGLGIFARTGTSENPQTQPIINGGKEKDVQGRGLIKEKPDPSGQGDKHVMGDWFTTVSGSKPRASKCQLMRQDGMEIGGVFGTVSLQKTSPHQLEVMFGGDQIIVEGGRGEGVSGEQIVTIGNIMEEQS